ncbi:WD40 repeat-containing protein [Cavenderia fasciculata]|uniref:WD40 repeat-containing protein n=1 Tax=Cavenderia fasciculata TaxID=261658 RepID=F4PT90_CACFS|nr:WD40 repeat-containing protein [Cavenderia fasciculata]EGG20826.1 WD40 repeat-containing protein [Cavenderia fasciculata]|eukprot:XP_004358676.1 WD40 repeat-containing protein [Cavenderia fasciculata]
MLAQSHCFEQYIKSVPDHGSIVYGEYLSKLTAYPRGINLDNNNPLTNIQQLPYDLQLERHYFTDLTIPMVEHKDSTSVMMTPTRSQPPYIEPIRNIQSVLSTVTNQLNQWLTKKDEVVYDSIGFNDCDVKSICWHPKQRLLAICNRNDVVLIYSFPSNGVVSHEYKPLALWMEFQSSVIDMQWKTHNPLTLAVSCKNGIILWEIDLNDFNSLVAKNNINKMTQPSMTNATILNYPCFIPTTMSWRSDGLLLASGSRSLNSIVVWDVASRVPSLVPRYGGNAVVSFSPMDDLLLSASNENTRIFETSKWDYNNKQWAFNSNYISSGWTPLGDYLALASGDQINFIQYKNKALDTFGGNLVHVEKTTTFKITQNGNDYHVGGHIRQIAISPDGTRMAVIFLKNRSETDNDRLIAIYRIKTHPTLIITPRGFIRKLDQSLQSIQFVPNYSKGSLLSATYVDGVVSFFPLLYTTSNQSRE